MSVCQTKFPLISPWNRTSIAERTSAWKTKTTRVLLVVCNVKHTPDLNIKSPLFLPPILSYPWFFISCGMGSVKRERTCLLFSRPLSRAARVTSPEISWKVELVCRLLLSWKYMARCPFFSQSKDRAVTAKIIRALVICSCAQLSVLRISLLSCFL